MVLELFASDPNRLPGICRNRTEHGRDPFKDYTRTNPHKEVQLYLSLTLGIASFLAFCLLRPRWTGLYAARKKQQHAAAKLPDLPKSFFGWIPVLYRITEEEVLASAGLDAFVFLRFFKLAIKYLSFVLFFVLTVIWPVHNKYDQADSSSNSHTGHEKRDEYGFTPLTHKPKDDDDDDRWVSYDWLWVYVIFAYVFTAAAMYLIITETNHVIKVRQRYLSTHSTGTDRTIRLSGIPRHLRSEKAIKDTIEDLQIGKVVSVTLCKNWLELDALIDRRMSALRKLEEAWTVQLGTSRRLRPRLRTMQPSHDAAQDSDNDDEAAGLLQANGHGSRQTAPPDRSRPTTRIWYGFMGLRSKKVDAIDYFEEQTRRLDDQIKAAREKEPEAASIAFVTLDSIAACQMAIQATIDPMPMHLIANPAPAPEDVVWRNTYIPRRQRMVRAWTITFFVAILTIVWWAIFFPLSVFLNLEAIGKISPPVKDFLCAHERIATLVDTTLPSLGISLMLVLVPYLYDWLSNMQGMTSQSDAEMSVISKNFFFTFFNLFISFTIFGTASQFYTEGLGGLLGKLKTEKILNELATSLANLSTFYTNLILLQAIGLSPFRLLEFGAVSLYPIGLMGSKTPRDYAELMYPPIFSYGFYLPQILFIFLICIVYSVLKDSQLMLFYGIIYFLFSAFIYKYQLLYAMDHRHFSTGRAWIMICNRILIALLIFQVTIASQLGLKTAWRRALLMVPLFAATVWFSFIYSRTYEPLMKFIALRSLHEAKNEPNASVYHQPDAHPLRPGAEVDLSETYVNPSLVMPLEDVWLSRTRAQRASLLIEDEGMDMENGEALT